MVVLAQIGSASQWLILLIVCLVIFGAKRLPDLARNLGRSLAAFKKAKHDFEEELMKDDSDTRQKNNAPETSQEQKCEKKQEN